MSLKRAVIQLSEGNPHLSARQIALRIGCPEETVRTIWYRAEMPPKLVTRPFTANGKRVHLVMPIALARSLHAEASPRAISWQDLSRMALSTIVADGLFGALFDD